VVFIGCIRSFCHFLRQKNYREWRRKRDYGGPQINLGLFMDKDNPFHHRVCSALVSHSLHPGHDVQVSSPRIPKAEEDNLPLYGCLVVCVHIHRMEQVHMPKH